MNRSGYLKNTIAVAAAAKPKAWDWDWLSHETLFARTVETFG
jgi:hypothetical protein